MLFIFIFLLGCTNLQQQNQPTASAEKTTLATALIKPKNSPTLLPTSTKPIYTPVPTKTSTPIPSDTPNPQIPNQRTLYIIKATFNYAEHLLSAEEEIRYFNNSLEPINQITFIVEPKYYTNVFHLNQISIDNEPLLSYNWENNLLNIQLNTSLDHNDFIDIHISFDLSLPVIEQSKFTHPMIFGYTHMQQNFVDWYPFIPPYQPSGGWLTHPKGYYGEHLVYETSDFDISIKILDETKDMLIAASARDHFDGEWHRYSHNNARNFVWSISDQYHVSSKQIGYVTVLSYSFEKDINAEKAVLETTSDAIELYSQLFFPYQHNTITAVEADFHDGMEYDGLYFLGKGFYNLYRNTPGEYLITIAAHETAHQWWYALVGSDQAMEPWLDEAMCTYTEKLFYEFIHPEAVSWWWDYRINYYQPQGWVNQSIYNPYTEDNAYRAYRDAVYLNGAVFLNSLRKEIGNDAFFAFLKTYANQYAFQIVTADDFFKLLEQFTNKDVKLLKKGYFYDSW